MSPHPPHIVVQWLQCFFYLFTLNFWCCCWLWCLCSRRTDQHWQKPGGGRTCWVGDVVRAVDFAQRNGDVSGCTVKCSERRGTAVPDRSGIDGPWPPTSLNVTRSLTSSQCSSSSRRVAAASVHDQTCSCRWSLALRTQRDGQLTSFWLPTWI